MRVIKYYDIREDGSSLVVKFITTDFGTSTYILNMGDDDSTYTTNVEKFCVWLFGMLLKNSSFQPVGEMVSSHETTAS